MCTVKHYQSKGSKTCKHAWLVIDTPCGHGRGFSNCPIMKSKKRRIEGTHRYADTKEDCPWHGLKGNYDFNLMRVIEKERMGIPSFKEVMQAVFLF